MTVLELFSAETKGQNKEITSYPGEAFKAECELVGQFASSGMWGMTVYKKDGIWYECFRSFTGVSWYKYPKAKECYKGYNNGVCRYDCGGLCRESC